MKNRKYLAFGVFLIALTDSTPVRSEVIDSRESEMINCFSENWANSPACNGDIFISDEMFDSDTTNFDSQEEVDESPIIQPSKNINYVSMPRPAKPKEVFLSLEGSTGVQSTLRGIGRTMKEFVERMARGKVKMTTSVGPIRTTRLRGPNKVRLVLKPGAHSRVPVIGNAVTAKHELMHQFGLGHANTRIWDTQTKVKQFSSSRDPLDVMTTTPGKVSLNAPHIHHLGWFSETEEAYAEVGGEYILRLLNDGNRDFESLKSLYYPVPDSDRKIWFSYVRMGGSSWKVPDGMPGTAIAIHSATKGGTFLEGIVGLNNGKTNIRSGLILEVSEPTSKSVKVRVTKDPNWVLEN